LLRQVRAHRGEIRPSFSFLQVRDEMNAGSVTRLIRVLSVASWAVLLGNPAAADPAAAFHSHVRPEGKHLRAVMSLGVDLSPTLRAIVERIEASDVVVYVTVRPVKMGHLAGHSSFVGAAAGRRYLQVVLDSRIIGPALIGLLAHELQHIAEITDEPSVVDDRSLAAFYQRIGFSVSLSGNRFESAAAIEAGRRAARDASAHGATIRAVSRRVTR
jgi:hypothetical protein